MRDTLIKPEIAICYVKVSKLSLPLNELTRNCFSLNHLHYTVWKINKKERRRKKKDRKKDRKKENKIKEERKKERKIERNN